MSEPDYMFVALHIKHRKSLNEQDSRNAIDSYRRIEHDSPFFALDLFPLFSTICGVKVTMKCPTSANV